MTGEGCENCVTEAQCAAWRKDMDDKILHECKQEGRMDKVEQALTGLSATVTLYVEEAREDRKETAENRKWQQELINRMSNDRSSQLKLYTKYAIIFALILLGVYTGVKIDALIP
jgi:hypothetical protein